MVHGTPSRTSLRIERIASRAQQTHFFFFSSLSLVFYVFLFPFSFGSVPASLPELHPISPQKGVLDFSAIYRRLFFLLCLESVEPFEPSSPMVRKETIVCRRNASVVDEDNRNAFTHPSFGVFFNQMLVFEWRLNKMKSDETKRKRFGCVCVQSQYRTT